MLPETARRSAIFLALTIAMAIGCLSLSCIQLEFQGLGYDYLSESYLESLPQDSSRAYWLRLYRVIELVNDTLFKRLQYLDIEDDSAAIDSLIEDYKKRMDFETRPDTPDRNEWWEEIWNVRATHCDSFYSAPYMKQLWDIRARPVLLLGPPTYERVSECGLCRLRILECRRCSLSTCQFYTMEWNDRSLSLEFYDLGCDGVYDEMTTSSKEFARRSETLLGRTPEFQPFADVRKKLKAAVDVVAFPEGEDFTLWMCSGVGIDQFMPDIHRKVSFRQNVIVSKLEPKPRVVLSDSIPSLLLPLPDSTRDLESVWIPQCFGGYRLPAGSYDIFLTIQDDFAKDHVGAYRTTVTLPSSRASKGISEILVAVEPAGKVFEGTANRIVRGDRTLLGNPAYYHRGDTINPYLEIDLSEFKQSKSGTYDYTIIASLYRSKESFGKPTTTIGDVFEVTYDTLDDAPSKTLLRKPQRKGEGMIYSTTRSSKSSRVFFQEPMVLPQKMSAGKHILVISAQDASSRKYLTSWRELRVKK